MPFVEEPAILSVLLADALYVDNESGKYTILGCFGDLWFSKFPATYPGFFVFLAITDGRGSGDLVVRLVDVDDEHEVQIRSVSLDLRDPRLVLQFPVRFDQPTFPKPGEYRIQILANDSPLIERRLVIYKRKRP